MRNLLLSTTAGLSLALAAQAQEGGPLQNALDGGLQMLNAQGANITYDSREVGSDNSVTYSGVSVAPEDDDELILTTDWVTFTPAGDMEGGVTVTMAPLLNVSVIEDDAEMDIAIETRDMALTTNLLLGGFAAPRVTLSAASLSARNETPDSPMLERLDLQMNDMDFSFALDMASGDSDASLTVADMMLDLKVNEPESGAVLADQRSDSESVEITFTGSNLPVSGSEDDIMAFLGEDGSFRLTMQSGAGTSTMGPTADLPVSIEGSGESGSAEVSLQEGIVGYTTNLGAITYVFTPDPDVMPLPPMEASLAGFDMEVRAPLRPTESLQEAKFVFNLRELAVSDTAWSMIDPEGRIPRDPATLEIDLSSMLRLLVPLQQIEDVNGPTDAAEIDTVDIRKVHLDVGGAELDADGALSVDNSGPIPFPNGAIDISVRGAQTLADTLVGLGLVDEMDVGMVMGMLMAFAEQGDGPDHFTSTIEFKDGGVFANGQPIQ